MGIFKPVRTPVIRHLNAPGGDISPNRPQYVAKTAPCTADCQSAGDIRGWLTAIAEAEAHKKTPEDAFRSAWEKIASRNPFPAVCGRVCPHHCEGACQRGGKDGPVAIHAMERFLGDFALQRGFAFPRAVAEQARKVAITGAGPAALSCAYQLARRGYRVTVYDAAGEAGGFLRRVPGMDAEVLDREIARILDLGVVVVPEAAPENVAFTDPEGDLEQLAHLIAQGRLAAEGIDAEFRGLHLEKREAAPVVRKERVRTDWYPASARHETILTEAEAIAEARRCLSCGICMGCGNCWMYCANGCFEKTPQGNRYKLKVDLCHGCSRCSEECPSGYIDMI